MIQPVAPPIRASFHTFSLNFYAFFLSIGDMDESAALVLEKTSTEMIFLSSERTTLVAQSVESTDATSRESIK